jgi:ABC-type phosphate/phosphonate transport system substrate-binding protein
MIIKKLNLVLILLMVLTACFTFSSADPQSPAAVPHKKSYTIGFIRSLFSEVVLSDAQAALKIWVKEIVKAYHYNEGYNLKAKIYNGYDDLKEEMKQDSLAVVVLNTLDYLEFIDKIELDPVLVLSSRGDIFEQYYILVRKDDRYKNIKDLKGADIGQISGKNQTASRYWLDVTLAKNNITDKSKFFKKVITSDKESQLILNLFFGHLDACIVSKGAFALMKELNPQIESKIMSIQNSPGYLIGLICYVRNVISDHEKELFYTNVLHIQELNSGKQLLSLIKVEKFTDFKREYLNSTKELAKEYNNLVKSKKIRIDEPELAKQ